MIARMLLALTLGALLTGCATQPPRPNAPAYVAGVPPEPSPPQAPNREMGFYIPACWGYTADCPNRIYAIGDIMPDSPARFAAFATWVNGQIARGVRPGPAMWMVLLDSNGGNLYAGLQLGELLRAGTWNTATGLSYEVAGRSRVATCVSACVYTFAGGVNRLLFADHALIVHQFSFSGGRFDKAAAAQITTARINLFLDRMGVSRLLQDVAGLTPSSTGMPLTKAEALQLDLAHLTPALVTALRAEQQQAAR